MLIEACIEVHGVKLDQHAFCLAVFEPFLIARRRYRFRRICVFVFGDKTAVRFIYGRPRRAQTMRLATGYNMRLKAIPPTNCLPNYAGAAVHVVVPGNAPTSMY